MKLAISPILAKKYIVNINIIKYNILNNIIAKIS